MAEPNPAVSRTLLIVCAVSAALYLANSDLLFLFEKLRPAGTR